MSQPDTRVKMLARCVSAKHSGVETLHFLLCNFPSCTEHGWKMSRQKYLVQLPLTRPENIQMFPQKSQFFATNLDENFPTSLQKYPVFLPLTRHRNYTKIFLKSAFVVVPMYEMCRFEQTCVLQTCQMPTCYLEAVPSSPRRDNISPPESRPVL